MLKKKVWVMLLVVGFFMITPERILAECSTIIYSVETNKDVIDTNSPFKLETVGTGATKVQDGDYICNVELTSYHEGGLWGRGWIDVPLYKVLKCEGDSFAITECKPLEPLDQRCTQNGTTAICEDVNMGCRTAYKNDSLVDTTGYNNGKRKNFETGCVPDTDLKEYGTCNGATGEWYDILPCPNGTYCDDEMGGKYTCRKATCSEGNVTAGQGDTVCVGNYKKTCDKGKFNRGVKCDGQCANKGGVPMCFGTGDSVGVCMEFEDGTGGSSINRTVPGESACYNDTVYKCTEAPYFDKEGIDCKIKGEVCVKEKLSAYAKCILPEDAVANIENLEDNSSNTASNAALDPSEYTSIEVFCTGEGDTNKIATALGCIPYEINTFIPWLLTWLFGVVGGIAFLLMVYGFILIATSSGDEKKVQGAKETITSAIIGLLVCIFSIVILRFIIVNILQIPGII